MSSRRDGLAPASRGSRPGGPAARFSARRKHAIGRFALADLDIHLFRLLHGALSGAWLLPMVVLTTIGGWGALTLVPLLALARTRRFAVALTFVLGATTAAVFVAKRLARRPRPPVVLPDVHARVFGAPTDFSFPSGHAAGSFAFAVFLAVVLVKTAPASFGARLGRGLSATALVALATGVALSRVAIGVHFPGDVASGAVVGTVIAAVGVHGYLRGRPRGRI